VLHATNDTAAKAPTTSHPTRRASAGKAAAAGFSTFVDDSLSTARPEPQSRPRGKAEAADRPTSSNRTDADSARRNDPPARREVSRMNESRDPRKPEPTVSSSEPAASPADAPPTDAAPQTSADQTEAAAPPVTPAIPIAVLAAAPLPPAATQAQTGGVAAGAAIAVQTASKTAAIAEAPPPSSQPAETAIAAEPAVIGAAAKPEIKPAAATAGASAQTAAGEVKDTEAGAPQPLPGAALAAHAKPGAKAAARIDPNAAAEQAEAGTAQPHGEVSAAQPHEHQIATANTAAGSDFAVTPGTVQPSLHTAHPAAAAAPAGLLPASQPVPVAHLGVELAARVQSGASRFEIRLEPAELGRIDVRIEIDRHGQVSSHMTVEKPETLAMLKQDAPQLQRALADAGLKTFDGGLQFSLGDQSQPRQNPLPGEQQHGQRFHIRDDEATAAAPPVRSYGRLLGGGRGIDIRV
jgi:chemotaxis protein MotD